MVVPVIMLAVGLLCVSIAVFLMDKKIVDLEKECEKLRKTVRSNESCIDRLVCSINDIDMTVNQTVASYHSLKTYTEESIADINARLNEIKECYCQAQEYIKGIDSQEEEVVEYKKKKKSKDAK